MCEGCLGTPFLGTPAAARCRVSPGSSELRQHTRTGQRPTPAAKTTGLRTLPQKRKNTESVCGDPLPALPLPLGLAPKTQIVCIHNDVWVLQMQMVLAVPPCGHRQLGRSKAVFIRKKPDNYRLRFLNCQSAGHRLRPALEARTLSCESCGCPASVMALDLRYNTRRKATRSAFSDCSN